MQKFFDTHAHLNNLKDYPKYPCLNVTTIPSDWPTALDIHSSNSNILPALGIHPWFVNNTSADDITQLESLLATHKISAIGEVGLDFQSQYIGFKAKQIEVFEQMLDLASRYHLPISVHCVKAHNELLKILKSYKTVTGVIHGLGSSIEIVSQYVDLGYKIGVNGVLCKSNARRYHEMVQYFPLENFVLETDYPNILLPDSPFSSMDDIEVTAFKMAILTNTTKEAVLDKTFYNAKQLFLR